MRKPLLLEARKPDFLHLFMKERTCNRVVPAMSATVSRLTSGITVSDGRSSPK